MKAFAIPYILCKLGVNRPILAFCELDKNNDILNNFTYKNFKTNYDKYVKMMGSGNNKNINNPPPAPISIKKFIDKYKNEKEDFKTEVVKYKNINYTFKIYHDNELAYYYLFRTNNENPNEACIHIIIDKINKKCTINNLLYQPACLHTTDINDKKGSTLIKLALILLNKIKAHYKLRYIQLTDNSAKICKNKHKIELHKMMTLITGTTWYGKYGFIPKNKDDMKQFEENKKIMNNIYLKNIPELEKYIIYGHKKSKSDLSLEKILSSYRYALENNYTLKDFLSKFLLNYDNTCDIFYYFYSELYNKLKLYDMRAKVFIKILN